MKLLGTLLKNELKLSIRNMNMVIFAVTMPLIVLVVLGFIYGTKPAADGTAYTFMEQSFGALCCISICAGGLMGLPLVVSEYRERKILKRFQVTPVSPAKLLLVEFLIYVIYCIVSMLTLFPAAMLFWKIEVHGSFLLFLGSWFLTTPAPGTHSRAAACRPSLSSPRRCGSAAPHGEPPPGCPGPAAPPAPPSPARSIPAGHTTLSCAHLTSKPFCFLLFRNSLTCR